MEGLKAQDLRIGNWVDHLGYIGEVEDIQKETIGVFINGVYCSCYIEDLKPIRSTKEWLIKFGFILNNEWEEITNPGVQYEKDIKYHNVKKYESKDYDNRFIYFIVEHGFIYCYVTPRYLTKIKNVHQLQNIFYSIKGSELVMDN